jgi:hypothetical protein
MPRIARFLVSGEDDQDGANRQTASLAGLAVALLLVVAGLFLIHQLHSKTLVEDCLMAGRADCDRLLSATR